MDESVAGGEGKLDSGSGGPAQSSAAGRALTPHHQVASRSGSQPPTPPSSLTSVWPPLHPLHRPPAPCFHLAAPAPRRIPSGPASCPQSQAQAPRPPPLGGRPRRGLHGQSGTVAAAPLHRAAETRVQAPLITDHACPLPSPPAACSPGSAMDGEPSVLSAGPGADGGL